ncbi:creatininase family protein [Brevundimonas terrae]|uniref:Creatininase family protein n=1 Tax=Brevundimonas terrae TaxID=363631 RepID=A0ABN0Y334_9CAUL|nr:creatininase family protein [Brevundimonas terrae]NIJ25874.1 creatinine amidohydrolase/Fe(II)-dependent formamide hydrolase-like protein [Brevundimonas terrae]
MLIHLSSWPEIDAYLKSGQVLAKTVIVPIGSNEQHGPTGLLGTDWLCPEIIAHAAEKADETILVAPTFNIGMAQHHLAFPGTITLRPSTFMGAIADWVSSLARHGFERIYFLNGHGGNVATIEAAFAEIYAEWSFTPEPWAERPPFVMKLRNWWDLPGVQKLCEDIFPVGHGSHATPSEIAVTYAAYPDRVKTATYEPKIAPTGPIRDANDYRARFPDGRIGSDPAQATPEKGQQIIDFAVPALIADVNAFANEVLPVA